MRTEAAELIDDGAQRDRRGRRMVRREQREQLVRAFHASGLTQAAFARREGLNPKTLSHWVKPTVRPTPAVAAPLRFARVSLPATSPGLPATVEVTLPDGTIVRGGDAHAVAQLVRALRD
jgi:hypothetical protein